MARVSIVVPIYNVEPYLAECLDSIAAQTLGDFEVVMVDDGSTDASAAIAERYVAADKRFRLISQANGGLSKARNTGAAAATGEFLSFVDSDDVLAEHAYEILLESLEETGSDFATGNVYRLTLAGTNQAPFLAKVFTKTRQQTHINEFRQLLVDRIVPNKLWRRSFWDQHRFKFPEGRLHEDIPVVLPAYFLARSVDVIADPIYYYRVREIGGLSITQRRLEKKALMDRITAIEEVSEFLRTSGRRRAKRWYEQSVLEQDLRYHLDVFDRADDAYRAAFLEHVGALLGTFDAAAFEHLRGPERRQWELVRERRADELAASVRARRDAPAPLRVRLARRIPERYRRRLRGLAESLSARARR